MDGWLQRVWTCWLIVVFIGVSTAWAQVDRATVSGIVTDVQGAVVPGATVTATNLSTNVASSQVTTETGAYQVVNLIPGRYRVEVELSGFKKVAQVVTLEVGDRARLDLTLQAGSFSETVTVAESTRLLNSNDANLAAVIPQTQVANLPLAIRNWDDLLALVPGVQGDRYTEQGAAPRSAAPAASTSMARGRCRTTSCWMAWTTTASRKTSRS